jgi:uncharacterized protein
MRPALATVIASATPATIDTQPERVTARDLDMEVEMQCPVCDVALVMSERSGVEIDYCPKCRGIWLDRGELDRILERAETVPAANGWNAFGVGRGTAKHHDDDHDRHGGYEHRRKSFWREIFD